MPIIRKVTPTGDSWGITLPKSWVEDQERKAGHKITEVSMEVNGDIVIKPYLRERI